MIRIIALVEGAILPDHIEGLDLPAHELPALDELPYGVGVRLVAVLQEAPLQTLPEEVVASGVLAPHVEQIFIELDDFPPQTHVVEFE